MNTCPYCDVERSFGHDTGCPLAPSLTQYELADLQAVAFRSRIDPVSDREPMIYSSGLPIPWLVAVNLDPSRF